MRQRLRQREWEAECGFCSKDICRHGSKCQRSFRTVAYDSAYDDDEEGWSMVGCRGGHKENQTGQLQAYGMDDGRFALLEDLDASDSADNETFHECACDSAGFRFLIREERRTKQQQRRRQEGQQRKGRTARKREAAATTETHGLNGVSVQAQSRKVYKRVCWLKAKRDMEDKRWQQYIEARDAASSDGDGYWELGNGVSRVSLLQAREQEFKDWEDAVRNVLRGVIGQSHIELDWESYVSMRQRHRGVNDAYFERLKCKGRKRDENG
jgi:hypothetical protein